MRVRALTVGPIQGYTTPNAIRIWGRGDLHELTDGEYHRVFGVAQLRRPSGNVTTKYFKMLPKFDCTGTADFKGLKSDERYDYRVGYFLGELEPQDIERMSASQLAWDDATWHKCMAAPKADGEFSLLLGSCRFLARFGIFDNRGDKTFRTAVDQVGKTRTDALVMVGDQIYADDLWKIDPATRKEEFFEKYRKAFSQPHLRQLMSRVATYMMLDDHEIRNNWSRDEMSTDEMRELFVAAMSAYEPYQVVHGPAFQPTNADDEDNRIRQYWHDFDLGRGSFFFLDTRTERSALENEMIGPEQMQALKSWITRKKARLQFVVTSVPFFPDRESNDDDKWAGFSDQRLEILAHIADRGAKNVVFLSGDIHASGYAAVECHGVAGTPITVHQVISSPFYWPGAPGNSKRFRKHSLGSRGAFTFDVSDVNYFTDKDNFVRISTKGKKLEIACYGRKGKEYDRMTAALA